MTGYEVKIAYCSKELTAKERIMLKDTTDAIKLDEATQGGSIIITPSHYAELQIHNEKADDKDYTQCIIIDTDGQKYVTGSASFWDSFQNIAEEMENEDEEWSIKVYRVPSKNYKGKEFLSCSII